VVHRNRCTIPPPKRPLWGSRAYPPKRLASTGSLPTVSGLEIMLTDMGRIVLDGGDIRRADRTRPPCARSAIPKMLVGAVVFFAFDDAAFMTGQTLNVDGGILLSCGEA